MSDPDSSTDWPSEPIAWLKHAFRYETIIFVTVCVAVLILFVFVVHSLCRCRRPRRDAAKPATGPAPLPHGYQRPKQFLELPQDVAASHDAVQAHARAQAHARRQYLARQEPLIRQQHLRHMQIQNRQEQLDLMHSRLHHISSVAPAQMALEQPAVRQPPMNAAQKLSPISALAAIMQPGPLTPKQVVPPPVQIGPVTIDANSPPPVPGFFGFWDRYGWFHQGYTDRLGEIYGGVFDDAGRFHFGIVGEHEPVIVQDDMMACPSRPNAQSDAHFDFIDEHLGAAGPKPIQQTDAMIIEMSQIQNNIDDRNSICAPGSGSLSAVPGTLAVSVSVVETTANPHRTSSALALPRRADSCATNNDEIAPCAKTISFQRHRRFQSASNADGIDDARLASPPANHLALGSPYMHTIQLQSQTPISSSSSQISLYAVNHKNQNGSTLSSVRRNTSGSFLHTNAYRRQNSRDAASTQTPASAVQDDPSIMVSASALQLSQPSITPNATPSNADRPVIARFMHEEPVSISQESNLFAETKSYQISIQTPSSSPQEITQETT